MKARPSTCLLLCPVFPSRKQHNFFKSKTASSRASPKWRSVFGAVGRSDSPTDNAPLDMYDTTIMLKPREQVADRG